MRIRVWQWTADESLPERPPNPHQHDWIRNPEDGTLRRGPAQPVDDSGEPVDVGVFLPPGPLIAALSHGMDLVWEVHDELDLLGDVSGAEDLNTWHTTGRRVATSMLMGAVTRGTGVQFDSGALSAYANAGQDAIVTISAFDSTWYDIEGRDDVVSRLLDLPEIKPFLREPVILRDDSERSGTRRLFGALRLPGLPWRWRRQRRPPRT